MRIFKRLVSMGAAIIMATACGTNALADSYKNTYEPLLMSESHGVMTAGSYTNTFSPLNTLSVGGGYADSRHYTYNLDYSNAKATPHYLITIPANSGSGSVSVEFSYVHQGQVKYQKALTKTFSNSTSKQTLYASGSTSPRFGVSGSSNTDVYVRFIATSTNSKVKGTSITASLDVQYYS